MRQITEIIVHCSGTPRGMEVKAADIHRWHCEKGWNGIGYHYVIGLKGEIEIGREEKEVGAHCKGHNAHSIGVCYVGGVSRDGREAIDTRTDEQRVALTELIMDLRERYPGAKVYGHRDFANKECPCFDVHKEWGR